MKACAAMPGVVLAAGQARRMGSALKQCLPCRGETLVHRAARTALEAGLKPVWVVVGAESKRVSRAVDDLPIRLLVNWHWESGQSASVRLAAETLIAHKAKAAIFLVSDQPFITPSLLEALCRAATIAPSPIVTPLIAGERSTPVLLRAEIFPALLTLTGDQGARALFSQISPANVPWDAPLARVTIDTPQDYAQWCPEGSAFASSPSHREG